MRRGKAAKAGETRCQHQRESGCSRYLLPQAPTPCAALCPSNTPSHLLYMYAQLTQTQTEVGRLANSKQKKNKNKSKIETDPTIHSNYVVFCCGDLDHVQIIQSFHQCWQSSVDLNHHHEIKKPSLNLWWEVPKIQPRHPSQAAQNEKLPSCKHVKTIWLLRYQRIGGNRGRTQ